MYTTQKSLHYFAFRHVVGDSPADNYTHGSHATRLAERCTRIQGFPAVPIPHPLYVFAVGQKWKRLFHRLDRLFGGL